MRRESVTIKGEPYLLVTETSPNGRLAKRMLVGRNYQELLVDLDHNGSADIWEVTEGQITVRYSYPAFGQFRVMEVVQRKPTGLIEAKFFLTPDQKKYRQVDFKVRPYRKYGASASRVVIGNLCEAGEKSGAETTIGAFQDAIRKMQEQASQSEADAVTCMLKKYEKAFFDKNCFEGKFSGSLNDIRKGLSDVIASAVPGPAGSQARFLQCLDQNKLGFHSARIQTMLNMRLMDMTNALNALGAGNSRGDDKSCAPIPFGDETKIAFENRLISCEVDDSGNWRGSADEDKMQVVLHLNGEETEKSMSCSAHEGYGRTFFHEMLHLSGIEDETFVGYIENCCGKPEDPSSQQCEGMRLTVQTYELMQAYEYSFQTKLEGYAVLKRELLQELGPSNNDALFDGYISALMSKEKDHAKAYSDCQKSESKGRQTCDTRCVSTCSAKYQDMIFSEAKSYAQLRCDIYTESSLKKTNCEKLSSSFAQVMSGKGKSPSRTPVTSGSQAMIAGITPDFRASIIKDRVLLGTERLEADHPRVSDYARAGGLGTVEAQREQSSPIYYEESKIVHVESTVPGPLDPSGGSRVVTADDRVGGPFAMPPAGEPGQPSSERKDIGAETLTGSFAIDTGRRAIESAGNLLRDAFLPTAEAKGSSSVIDNTASTSGRQSVLNSQSAERDKSLNDLRANIDRQLEIPNMFAGKPSAPGASRTTPTASVAAMKGSTSQPSSNVFSSSNESNAASGRVPATSKMARVNAASSGGSGDGASAAAASGSDDESAPGGVSNPSGGLAGRSLAGRRSNRKPSNDSGPALDYGGTIEFLNKPYKEVGEQLSSLRVRRSLILNSIQVIDHNNVQHPPGRMEKPSLILEYCKASQSLKPKGECPKGK